MVNCVPLALERRWLAVPEVAAAAVFALAVEVDMVG